jgi:cephalosporin hydroxylase
MGSNRLALGCALPRCRLQDIQRGTMNYRYKGVPTYKNPFDLALYQLLLWETKPRTLIEIGSKFGGSALWFADVLRNFEINYEIHSIDLNPVLDQVIPDVTFHRGDGRNLSATLPPDMMARLPRPLMIIDDADHRADTTLAILRFFDQWLQKEEYIIVEDGIVDDLFEPDRMAEIDGGPRSAIRQFLAERDSYYEIDSRLCDYFGTNVTWNVNGYLRRVA